MPRLCVHSHAYIHVSGTIIIPGTGTYDNARKRGKRNKGAIFKNCSPVTIPMSMQKMSDW